MQLVIKSATQDNLEDILSLYYKFFKELRSRQGLSPRGIDEYREEVREFLQRDQIFVAFLEEKPVGFIHISKREGAHWLEELYVVPDYRGMGIGRKLVEKAENYIKKRDSAAYIMVLPQDKAAIEFWIHIGYKVLNTIELAKDLNSIQEEDTRVFEVFGYPFYIWRWRKEGYDEVERKYLETLEKFYKLGGTRRLYLEIVTAALRKWINRQ